MKKGLHILIFAAVCICMAAGIHIAQEFRFYNIESNDLFLYDWADIASKLARTGGLATLLASFLTQFMRIPFAGTFILTGIYILSAWLLYRILRRRTEAKSVAGLCLLPAAFLFLCMENDYYRFQGHASFIMMLACFYAYVSMAKKPVRYIVGALMIPVLFHAAGSVAVVFAVTALLWEVLGDGLKGLAALIFPAVMGLTAVIYVRFSLVSGWEHALTPFMYYEWPSTYFFPAYAWAMVPAVVLAAWIIGRMDVKPAYAKAILALGLVISFFIAGNLYGKVHSRSYYRLIQEQYWTETDDWDRIIKTADRRQPTYLVSYLNLALAQKGILVKNFMYYNPQDLSRIMYPTPNLKTGLTLQSAVYSAWDYHAAARQAAFDANTVTSGNANPRQLMVLVKTNAALGAYDVAEKYISILEKTLFYRGMAAELRAGLEKEFHAPQLPDMHIRYEGLEGDMRDILEADPSQRIVSQFHQVYKIIEKEDGR